MKYKIIKLNINNFIINYQIKNDLIISNYEQ